MDDQNEDLYIPEKSDLPKVSRKLDNVWVEIFAIVVLLFLVAWLFKSPIQSLLSNLIESVTQQAVKPVIYLYPEEKTKVTVKLDFDEKSLTCTYPKYNNGWVVNAEPDGTIFTADGKEYSYLFWEAESTIKYDLSNGFIVKGTEAETFLQEKLSYMGMTPKEYNEFIVYWLPKLEANEYNFIKFAQKEYTDQFPLNIQPQPDSMLRVFMVMKAAKGDEKVQAQTLKPFERKGFAVVEWGGTELGD